MSSIIAKNSSEIKKLKTLLEKDIPTYRQAYSDRTSWLMACFSELAYLRFNPLFSNDRQKKAIDACIEEFSKKTNQPNLVKLINMVGYDHEAEEKNLINELKSLKAELQKTFDSNGTQAVLISTEKFIVLSFRGTEATSIKDIRTDAKAIRTKCESGGDIHSGFKEAFEEVTIEIQSTLNDPKYEKFPLFITGHSLGGALATIAAKELIHAGGIASCYTYGSPRVGDEKWISSIKTPLYRIVNAADIVTMMPPGANTISFISWILGFIPHVGKSIGTFLLSKFGGYLHGGDMRYLTNCASGDYNTVKILYSVSVFHRIRMLLVGAYKWNKLLADHSISTYRKKLLIVAIRRN